LSGSTEAIRLNTPLKEDEIRALRAGQFVLLSGLIVTGRDKLHKFLFNERPDKSVIPFPLEGGVLYHCGPVVQDLQDGQKVVAAGPTTSSRMEIYEPFVIEHYGIRAVMGKGGMTGRDLMLALERAGAVYLHTIGGAGALLAKKIKKVRGVWKMEEFGRAEAMWAFEVEDFPAVVTVDTHGENVHERVEEISRERLTALIK
jgi:fumarate hydratase subunit beta